jgi:hypothetical protein
MPDMSDEEQRIEVVRQWFQAWLDQTPGNALQFTYPDAEEFARLVMDRA